MEIAKKDHIQKFKICNFSIKKMKVPLSNNRKSQYSKFNTIITTLKKQLSKI